MKKSVSQVRAEVGRILSEWNPIGVDPVIAQDEYQRYIPRVSGALDSKDHLMSCLEDILVNDMELEYDSSNESHVRDLQGIAEKLLSI